MIQEIKTTCPLSWKITVAIASDYGRRYEYKKNYVLTAFAILLSSKSQNINTLQMANALAFYRFDIGKEGIEFLSSLGISVSYATLQRKLSAIEQKMVSDLRTFKAGLESNCVGFSSFF